MAELHGVTAGRRGPGRPSKGHREKVEIMVPPALKAAIKEKAQQAGMTANDYLASLAAEATGVPYSNQEAMSLAS